MKIIPKAIAAAVALYILIIIIQAEVHISAILQAAALCILLVAAGGVFLAKREEKLKTGEAVLLWISVLLFGVAGVLVLGGVP